MAHNNQRTRAQFTLIIATTSVFRKTLSPKQRWKLRDGCVRKIRRAIASHCANNKLDSAEVEMHVLGGDQS